MKKLICAAILVGFMAGCKTDGESVKTEAVPAVAKAKMEAQVLETVRKYVPEEEKAKALVKEIQDVMTANRRNMMRRPPKPSAAKPEEAK